VHDYAETSTILKIKQISELQRTDNAYVRACIEEIHLRPYQNISIVSQGKLITNYGEWIGILKAFEIPFDAVPPARWQKRFALGKKEFAQYAASNPHIPKRRLYGNHEAILDVSVKNATGAKAKKKSYWIGDLSANPAITTAKKRSMPAKPKAKSKFGWNGKGGVSKKIAKEKQKKIYISNVQRKEFHRQKAIEMYPYLHKSRLKYKKNHNRADALIIATYCKDVYSPQDFDFNS